MQLTLEKNYIAGKSVRVDDLGGQLFGGEANAHKFVITQYAAQSSAETIAITGSVSGTLMASTGATVPLTGSLEDGKAVVVLDEDCYKVPGRFVLTIFVTSGDATLCIYCGVGNILRTSTDTVVYPTESLPNLTQLVDQVQAAIDSFPADLTAIQAAIAANYDDLTYPIAAGTYAWHAGTLYKAKSDIATTEAWTAAHWETVHAANDLATDLSSLKSALNGVESAVGFEILFPDINKSININTGVVLPSNVVTENGFCCLCVPCVENDVFTVTGKGGNNTQLWGFADSNGTVIIKSGAGKTESNLKITAPTGSAYFAFNSYTNVSYGVTKGVSPVEKFDDIDEKFDDIDAEFSGLQTQVESIKNDLYEQTVLLSDASLHHFPVSNGTDIVITTANGTTLPEGNPYLQCFDSNGTFTQQFLCSSDYGTSRTVTISSGDVASVKMYAVPSKTIKVYIPDKNKLIPKVEEIAKIVGQNTIIVDASGSGDYTSFTEAIYDTVDDGIDVFVKPGTYNIVSEYVALFGQEAVDSMADADSSIFNGFQYGVRIRNRKIEFAPGAHLVCDWTGHTVDGTHRFSALGVDYDVEIIGLDLDVTGTFYCIHDDYGIATPYTVKYENCRVVGHNIYNANCIGGGCKKYSRHILNNCYFDNNLTGSATVRYHNTNAEGAEPEIYVSNCYFNNWFTPRWYGAQTSKMRVYVNNCHARAIYKIAESSSYDVDNVELYKWNNEETDPRT